MLIEIKNKIMSVNNTIVLEPKIYLNQSLYFETYVSGKTLVISFNKVDNKIYLYYRSKDEVTSFVGPLRNLGYFTNKHNLVCDVASKSVDDISQILFATLTRVNDVIYSEDLAIYPGNNKNYYEIFKGIKDLDLSRCVDRALERKIMTLANNRLANEEAYDSYLKYCCDVGFLELVYFTFENLDKGSIKLDKFKKLKPHILAIQNFSQDPYILELQIRALDTSKTKASEYFKSKLFSYFARVNIDEATPYNNMIICFLLMLLLKCSEKTLNANESIKLFNYFYDAPNMNATRREVCLLLIIEYCSRNRLSDFFKLPNAWYNHTGKILEVMISNSLLNDNERQELWQLYQSNIKKSNSLKITKSQNIAVCISGLYRNHYESLLSIKDNIVDPLNADVFVHTWDNMSTWSGCGGNADIGRILGVKARKLLPEGCNTLDNLSHIFPKTYKILSKPINQKIDSSNVFSVLNPSKVFVEREDEFVKSLGDLRGYMRVRTTPNQIKMFHGIKKSIDMALENKKYDYIIRCRPDINISSKVTPETIAILENNTLYTQPITVGITDISFLMTGSMAYDFSRFIDLMYEKNELSPFDEFPMYDSHNLLSSWVHANNYSCKPSVVNSNLLPTPEVSLPGLIAAVESDFGKLDDRAKSIFKDFVEYLIKRNG